MKQVSLADLEQKIADKCAEYTNGVTPQYHPHLPQMRQLSLTCAQYLSAQQTLFEVKGLGLPKKNNTSDRAKKVLSSLIKFVDDDINKHGEISFYHYLGLITATSFHYAKMVKENTYKNLNLEEEKTWNSLSWESCVWTLFFISGTLFEKPLQQHNEIFNDSNATIEDVSYFIKGKIRDLNK